MAWNLELAMRSKSKKTDWFLGMVLAAHLSD